MFLVLSPGLQSEAPKRRRRSHSPTTATKNQDYQAYRFRNNKAVKKWREKEKIRQEEHKRLLDALASDNQKLKEENKELKIQLNTIKSVLNKVCGCCGSK